jgi:hypothetical protein
MINQIKVFLNKVFLIFFNFGKKFLFHFIILAHIKFILKIGIILYIEQITNFILLLENVM